MSMHGHTNDFIIIFMILSSMKFRIQYLLLFISMVIDLMKKPFPIFTFKSSLPLSSGRMTHII